MRRRSRVKRFYPRKRMHDVIPDRRVERYVKTKKKRITDTVRGRSHREVFEQTGLLVIIVIFFYFLRAVINQS